MIATQQVQPTIVGLRFFLADGLPVTVILQQAEAAAIADTWRTTTNATQRLGGRDVHGMAWGVLSSAVRAVFTVSLEQLLREQGQQQGQQVAQQQQQSSLPWNFKSGLN